MYKETVTMPGQFQKLIGAPVSIIFNEPLSKETFDYWIKSTFGRVNNRFRLWGNPIILGPKKVHVYGVDKHLWKPIFLELTDKHLIAIVPKGTCGNTIHRLICNIQRYIDPAAKAYIGDMEYKAKAITKAYKDSGIPENDELFGKETANAPVCETCGTSGDMALIKFTDKNTGKPRSAWKCLQCGNWEGALSLFPSPVKRERGA